MMSSKMRMRRSINSPSCAFHSLAEKGRSATGRISASITALICRYRLSMLSKWRNTVRSPTPARAATASALGVTSPAPTSSSIARTIRSRLTSLRWRRPSVCSRADVWIFIIASVSYRIAADADGGARTLLAFPRRAERAVESGTRRLVVVRQLASTVDIISEVRKNSRTSEEGVERVATIPYVTAEQCRAGFGEKRRDRDFNVLRICECQLRFAFHRCSADPRQVVAVELGQD